RELRGQHLRHPVAGRRRLLRAGPRADVPPDRHPRREPAAGAVMSTLTGLRRRFPDFMGITGSWWDRTPWFGRWTVYLLLVIGAFLLPSETIGSFMTPEGDRARALFYPI